MRYSSFIKSIYFAVSLTIVFSSLIFTGKIEATRLNGATINQRVAMSSEQAYTSLNVIVIPIEFPDAKHTISRDELYKRISQNATNYLKEVSYGILSVTMDMTKDWIMMPKPFSSYDEMDSRYASMKSGHRPLIQDSIQMADAEVDYKLYSSIVLITPSVKMIPYSLFGAFSSADGSFTDRVSVQTERATYGTIVHELGHVMELDDLYEYAETARANATEVDWALVGPWCVMSSSAYGGHYHVFNKIKLGWILPERIKIVSPGSKELITLEPIENKTTGIQVIKIPLSNNIYYLIELRRKIGFDSRLPDEGILITRVDEGKVGKDTRILEFLKIMDSESLTKSLNDATYDIRKGKKNIYRDPSNNIAIAVLFSDSNASYVLITLPDQANQMIDLSNSILQMLSKMDIVKSSVYSSTSAKLTIKEANDKQRSISDSLKKGNFQAVPVYVKDIISMIDEANKVESKYIDASYKISSAEAALQTAQVEGRVNGLNEAIKLIEQLKKSLQSDDYDNAVADATKAKQTAEVATTGFVIDLWILLLIGGLVILVVAGVITIFILKRKKINLVAKST